MILYFIARFDLELKCKEESLSLKNGEMAFCDYHLEKIMVISKENGLGSYEFEFNQSLNYESSFYTAKRLNKESYLIELKPKILFLPNNFYKKIINFENNFYLIESYNSNLTFINTELQSYCFKRKYKHLNFEVNSAGNKKLLIVSFGTDTFEYYYIFDAEKLIFEGPVKEINIKDNLLTVLVDDISCYGQKRVVEYNLNDGKQEQYFVYSDDRDVNLLLDTVYLFMDSIKIKNYQLSKQYLSQDISNIAKEDLIEFLDCDNYYIIENVCVLEKNNEVNKIVHFEMFDNKIVDILD